MSRLSTLMIALCALLGTAATAQAAVVYSAATIQSGSAAGATFTANGGHLVMKDLYGVQGVGVSGGGVVDEIDVGESIDAVFASAMVIGSLDLSFLFDGPEFGDVQERASITATYADRSIASYTLTATHPNSYVWTGLGSVIKPDLEDANSGGAWTILDPFGGRAVTALSFGATPGLCATGLRCASQSDYAVSAIAGRALPEPSSGSLVAAALAAMGFVGLRRPRRR